MNSPPLDSVTTHEVAGVKVRRHVLDHEAARMCGVAQRLGRRLSYWLRTRPVHELPDQAFRETFRLYAQVTLGLLREQRERAKLKPGDGAPAVDDATFERELAGLARQALLAMPDEDLDAMLRERATAK